MAAPRSVVPLCGEFAARMIICLGAGRVHADRVSMVFPPSLLRNAALLYALPPASVVAPDLLPSHGTAPVRPLPGRALRSEAALAPENRRGHSSPATGRRLELRAMPWLVVHSMQSCRVRKPWLPGHAT